MAAAEAVADSGPVVVAQRIADLPWTLAPRSATLGGTIPLRAARSCPPLLGGNAFGLMLSPRERIRVRRGLRRVEIDPTPLEVKTRGAGTIEVVFETGIAVHAPDDARLALGRAYNRRDRRVSAVDAPVASGAPIRLALLVAIGLREELEIRGEVACVGAFLDSLALANDAERRALLRAHEAFFDEAYFRDKRGRPTNKYRGERRTHDPTASTVGRAAVAHVGGAPPVIARGADGILALRIAADMDVGLGWHGERVAVAFDARDATARAARIEASARAILGADLAPTALKYFTTYATAHAQGDPHMFLKPAVLVGGPPGTMLVVDGPDAAGIEGFRGATEASWFHALPAVAEMIAPRAQIRAGAPIVRARVAAPSFVEPKLVWRDVD